MTFNEFAKEVSDGLTRIFEGEEVEICTEKVTKNNGLVFTGINIRENGNNIVPTVYIDDFYKEDISSEDIDEIVHRIKQLYSSRSRQIEENITADKYNDFEWVKDKIVYTLVNYEMNKEMLKDVPFLPYQDLAVIFRCVFHKGRGGMASAIISDANLRKWHADTLTLYKLAVDNTPRIFPPVIEKITAMLENMADLPEHLFDELSKNAGEMYVLTNSSGLNGASTVLYKDVLDECAKKAGGNIYLMPSSIHEMIFINENLADDVEVLSGIVKDVNDNVVNKAELLSYNVYYYNCHRKELAIVGSLESDM